MHPDPDAPNAQQGKHRPLDARRLRRTTVRMTLKTQKSLRLVLRTWALARTALQINSPTRVEIASLAQTELILTKDLRLARHVLQTHFLFSKERLRLSLLEADVWIVRSVLSLRMAKHANYVQ
jgi:hypothetical protein